MKVDFGAHLPFYLQHEECERISNFTCRRTTLRAPRHAKQAGRRTGHSRRPSAKAPVLVHRCAAGAPAVQLAPNTRLAAAATFDVCSVHEIFVALNLLRSYRAMRIAY